VNSSTNAPKKPRRRPNKSDPVGKIKKPKRISTKAPVTKKKVPKKKQISPATLKLAVSEELYVNQIGKGVYIPFCKFTNRDGEERSTLHQEAIKCACLEYAKDKGYTFSVSPGNPPLLNFY
jgi:hypothetical protein